MLSLRFKYSRNQDEELFFDELYFILSFADIALRCELDIISALFPFGSVLCV